jgi:hypothetical protein
MRRIKFLLALAAAMATLLAMTAAPAMANHRDDDWNGWRAPSWHGADWEDALGVAEIELDDCFWWHRDLFCEVDT